MTVPVPRRVDMLNPGDIVLGTLGGDHYHTPRTIAAIDPAPEHAHRMMAYRLTWHNGHSQVYYGDTTLHIQA